MNKRPVLQFCVWGAFLALLVILIVRTASYSVASEQEKRPVIKLSNVTVSVNGETLSKKLPRSIDKLPARTPVTVTVDVTPKEGDFLYIKSVYSPIKVYADETLIYSSGQPGTFPSFMQDPATTVGFARFPLTNRTVHLRAEYLSPTSRDMLTIHPMLMGTQTALVRHLCAELGFSFAFAVLLIFGGLLLIFVALFVISYEKKGIAFLWLGLFALSAGAWTFGECNLTGLLIRNPTLLYLLAFAGLFALPVPMIRFGLTVVKFHRRRALVAVNLVLGVSASIALLLQLLGVVSLSKSMYVFHVIEPLALCVFAGHLLYESVHYHEETAERFLMPMAVLALFSVLEVINYNVHITYIMSLFFQIGIFIFLLMTGVIGGMFVREALQLRSREQRMQYEMQLMEFRMEEESKHQRLLLENQEAVRAQRHDLRHQLAVIRSFSEKADSTQLTEYLDSLVAAIPTEQGRSYCENAAVNAIVSHYAAQAEQQGIELSILLAVPAHPEHVPDSSLCVVIGNLLENAIEACCRMKEGKRFIRLRSRLQYDILTVTMDNSFDGVARQKDGQFLSSKREEIGTGLRSVTAMAGKYGGGTSFKTDGNIFLSSVYFKI